MQGRSQPKGRPKVGAQGSHLGAPVFRHARAWPNSGPPMGARHRHLVVIPMISPFRTHPAQENSPCVANAVGASHWPGDLDQVWPEWETC